MVACAGAVVTAERPQHGDIGTGVPDAAQVLGGKDLCHQIKLLRRLRLLLDVTLACVSVRKQVRRDMSWNATRKAAPIHDVEVPNHIQMKALPLSHSFSRLRLTYRC